MDSDLLFFDTRYSPDDGSTSFGYFRYGESMRLVSSGETTDAKEAIALLSSCLPVTYDLSYNYFDLVALYEEAVEAVDKEKQFISLFDFYRYKRHLHFYVDIGEVLVRLERAEGEGFKGSDAYSPKELARFNRILYEELQFRHARSKPGLYFVPSCFSSLGKTGHIIDGLNKRDDLIRDKLDSFKGKKRFVFFDIECANTDFAEGKICEFSYVVYDAKWNLVEQREILCNPGSGEENDFKLLGRQETKDLHLKYEENDYKAYRESPEFGQYAKEIADLLYDEDVALFGYEVESDLRFLAYSFQRYGIDLKPLFALDVKRVYQQLLDSPIRGLGDLVERFVPKGVSSNLRFHAAIDDAMATGLVLRYFLLLKGRSFDQILSGVSEDAVCELTTCFYPDPDLADPATYEKLLSDGLI